MSKPNSIRFIFPATFLLLVLGAIAYFWLSPSGVEPAPKVVMSELDGGRKINLASLHGHPVLVTFWATSCPGCVAEMPHLIRLYHELAPQGFKMIGVAMNYDMPSHIIEMQKQKHIPYPLVWDGSGEISRAFGNVSLTPTHFLIDPKGEIVQHKIGDIDIQLLRARVMTMLHKNKA